MREIKFRAWDILFKTMRYPAWKVGNALYFGENGFDAGAFHGEIKYDLMQYTGLKDKNGKEIYEGDILKVETSWYKSKKDVSSKFDSFVKGETFWSVEFKIFNASMGFFTYGIDRRFMKPLTKSRLWNANAEVISNIHENPELLEVQNG